jgi:type I restriction enzyme S subunit
MGNPKLMAGAMSKIVIPVPPIEVQRQIVETLGKYSLLITGTEEGIPAEIKARRRQYEYYRNKHLTFKPLDAA